MKARMGWALAAIAVAACSKLAAGPAPAPVAPAASAPSAQEAGVQWSFAANDAEVDAAFARARRENKPLFLYWGAAWCPPCNQLKATVFNRADFIARTRAFVPVYIDGDRPGAQRLGARFQVRGYPTTVLFAADGTETTRLPGEVDAAQYTQLLMLGMNARRPVKTVLADALRGAGLTPNEWELLAFYAWDTDEQQLAPQEQRPALLKQLAAACPPAQRQAATRLMLQAIAVSDASTRPGGLARQQVIELLADPGAARFHVDLLTHDAVAIVRALSAARKAQRAQLVEAFNARLKKLQADATLSRADRLTALQARVELAKIDTPKGGRTPHLARGLRTEVHDMAQRMDRETTDPYERQAVIPQAAELLRQAGLAQESDALLRANLATSRAPYYLMSQLAFNAKERGDTEAALRWSQQAFERAEGPATRLQWGASYVDLLLDLAPRDEARIEAAVHRVLGEAAVQPHAFHARSARSLQRMGGKLVAWNKGAAHAAALARMRAQLAGICNALGSEDEEQRRACEQVLTPAGR